MRRVADVLAYVLMSVCIGRRLSRLPGSCREAAVAHLRRGRCPRSRHDWLSAAKRGRWDARGADIRLKGGLEGLRISICCLLQHWLLLELSMHILWQRVMGQSLWLPMLQQGVVQRGWGRLVRPWGGCPMLGRLRLPGMALGCPAVPILPGRRGPADEGSLLHSGCPVLRLSWHERRVVRAQ